MCYTNPINDFKQGLTQLLTIVSIAELCEAKKAILELPLGWCCFVNPMTGNCKIAVYVSCLPGITGQVDFPSDCQTLDSISLHGLELNI